MRAVYWTFLLLSVITASLAAQRSVRSKRGIVELGGIIKCSTGRMALSYLSYGCYCGHGGKGWPRDDTDWCCHKHDCCYANAEAAGCETMTDEYLWACKDQEVDCDSITDQCEKMLCQCDSEAGQCLRNAPYNKKYALWPNFLCGSIYPTCNIY
ncbi:phospholipase A2-like [Clarias gariepinus]